MGHEMRELGDYKRMRQTYQRLDREHPRSKYRLEALLVLGNYHFDAARLDQAERQYRRILDAPPSRVHAMAAYRLAWSRINRADFAGALQRLDIMKEVAVFVLYFLTFGQAGIIG